MTAKNPEVAPEQSNGQISKTKDSNLPTDDEFSGHVTQALELQKRIREDTDRLEVLKMILRDAAQDRLPVGKKRNPAGESVQFTGVCGGTATVSFGGPKAIAAFWFQTDGMAWRFKDNRVACLGDVRTLAGDLFEKLFYTQFKPTKKFAEVVGALVKSKELSKGKGATLIGLCLEKSTPKVEIREK
jgi:hypothetical protein